MKAYRINKYDWFAANSFNEAVNIAVVHYAAHPDNVIDKIYATGHPEPLDMEVLISVKDLLESMDAPGICFGLERE